MSYLTMKGVLVNVLETPKGVTKKTGEAYGGRDQVQLLCKEDLKNGETRMVLQTLNLPEGSETKAYEQLVGKPVALAVSPYVMAGKLGFSLTHTQPKAGTAAQEPATS